MNDHDSASELTVRLVVPLDVPWLVASDVLGPQIPIEVDSIHGLLCLPGLSELHQTGTPPDGFQIADGVDSILNWAEFSAKQNNQAQLLLNQIAFEFDLRSTNPIEMSRFEKGRLSGIEDLKQATVRWIERFQRWTQFILGQPLDRTRPLETMLEPAGNKIHSWGEIDGRKSLISVGLQAITIVIDSDEPNALSELVLDTQTFQRFCKLSSSGDNLPPLALELLGAARLAAQRKEYRLAIVDLGTAAEALLRQRLEIPHTVRRTLGALIGDVRRANLDLPSDTEAVLLDPRNAAVHRGHIPDRAHVVRSLEIVQTELEKLDHQLSRPTHPIVGHRPQLFGLTIFTP